MYSSLKNNAYYKFMIEYYLEDKSLKLNNTQTSTAFSNPCEIPKVWNKKSYILQ